MGGTTFLDAISAFYLNKTVLIYCLHTEFQLILGIGEQQRTARVDSKSATTFKLSSDLHIVMSCNPWMLEA